MNASRRRRIAAGSGTSVQDVNRLVKQYQDMAKMMKRLGKAGGGDPAAMAAMLGGADASPHGGAAMPNLGNMPDLSALKALRGGGLPD